MTRILITDENTENLSLMEAFLKECGYQAATSEAGELVFTSAEPEKLAQAMARLQEPALDSDLAAQQRQAKEEQAQTLSLLRATLESTANGILVVNREGETVNLNKRFLSLWRLSANLPVQELLLQPAVMDQLADPEGFSARVQELSNQPEEESFDVVKLNDGQVFECYSIPQRVDGRVVGRVWSFSDITERRATERRLRQFSRVVEQSPAAVVITDTNGDIQYVNPKFTAITGYSFKEAIGCNPRILKSGDFPPEVYADLWKTITAGGEWHGEFHNKAKNGEFFWESASICPITDKSGAITHFLAVKEDITERKRAEEELNRYREHLEELVDIRTCSLIQGEIVLRTLINATPQAVFLMDAKGMILTANQTLAQRLKLPLKEVIGRDIQHLFPELVTEHKRHLDEAIRTRQMVCFEDESPKGCFEFHISPVLTDDGPVSQLAVVSNDITERKRAEAELRESEMKQRTILEAVQTGIILIDAETHVLVEANAVAARLIGEPKETILGRPCHQYLCSDGQEGACPLADAGELTGNIERTLLAAGGKRIPVLTTTVPITLGGRPFILESFIDITKRKEAEEELQIKSHDLEVFNKGMMGRELRVIELKEEVNKLCMELNRPVAYRSVVQEKETP